MCALCFRVLTAAALFAISPLAPPAISPISNSMPLKRPSSSAVMPLARARSNEKPCRSSATWMTPPLLTR